jgi:PAS domain S-box-containing protein
MKNLIETEQTPLALSQSRQVVLLLLDLQGNIHWCNPAFAQQFTYANTHNFFDYICPSDRSKLAQALQNFSLHATEPDSLILRLGKEGRQPTIVTFELFPLPVTNRTQPLIHLLGVDITAQVQLENQQQLMQQIHAYMNGLDIGVVMVDSKGCIIRTNRSFAELTGLHYNKLKGCFLPEVLPPSFAELATLFQKTDFLQQEHVQELQVAPAQWFEMMLYPNPFGAMFIFRDISETVAVKKALEVSRNELEKREEWYRNLLAYSIDVVLVTDAALQVQFVTDSVEKMLGYQPAEVLHQNAAAYIHPDDINAALTAFEKDLRREKNVRSVDMRLRCKNGTWKWVEAMGANRLDDGIINGVVIYLNDIEERKKTEYELSQSERKHKAVVDTSYNGIIISDYPGNIVSVNPALCSMFSYTQEEFLAKRVQDFMDFNDPAVLDAMRQLHTTGSFRGEMQAVHKTGRLFWVELHASFLYNEGGMHYYSTIVRDIDNERTAQLELEKREALLSAVAKATTLLITDTDWKQSVIQSMQLIGSCLQADRVYVFESHTDNKTGAYLHSQRFEWNSGVAEPQIDNPALQNMPHAIVQEIFQPLIQNKAYAVHVADIQDNDLRQILEAQNICSLLMLPVFLGGKYWGAVGFDACKQQRQWKSYEIETLRMYAATLGGVIERRTTERLIAESQRRYKLLFDENPAPLLTVRVSDLKIRNINRAAQAHYGYSREEFLRKKLSDICLVCGGMADEMREKLMQVTAEQKMETRHVTKSGAVIDVEITLQPLSTEDAEPHLLLLINDVTEAKRLQREKDLMDDITNQLLQPKLLEENLHDAIRMMRRHLQCDAAELWCPNYDNSFIKLSVFETELNDAGIEYFKNNSHNTTYTVAEYGSRPAFQSRTVIWVPDLKNDETLICRVAAIKAGFVSYVAVPLIAKGEVAGLLYFFSRNRRAKDKRLARLLTFFGNHVAAEIEKRRQEKELNVFFSLSSDGMTICGADGKYKKVNPAFCNIVGYSEEELVGMHFAEFVVDDDRSISINEFERLLKSSYAGVFENRIRAKNGEIKWLEWTSSYDEVEKIFLSSARDITEKKMAEHQLAAASAELQQALQENRKILDYSQDIIATFTKEGIINNINPACEQLLGYSPEDMLGEHLSMFVHTANLDQLLQVLMQLGAEDTTIKNYELQMQHRSGSTIDMEWTIHWSGAEQLAFAVARDITMQKKSEQALQESEKRFRMFMDNNPASAWIIDEEGTLLYINRQSNPLHIVDETYIGSNLYEHIDSRYVHVFRENNMRVLRENKPIEAVEVVPMKDGSEIIQLVYKFPVELDGKKRLIGGIGIDITAQKKAEEQLQISEQRFRSFMDNNPAGAWINNADGTFLFVSNEYSKIIRSPRPIKEGDNLYDLYDAQLIEQARVSDQQVVATGQTIEINTWLPRGDGSMGFYLIYKFPVPSVDGKSLVGGIILDVTDRKLAEDEVVRIKKAIDNASDAVLIFDKKLTCIYSNDAFNQLFGLDCEKLNQPGRSGFVLESISRDRRIFSELLKNGTWQGDLTMKDRHGKDIYISLRANVIMSEQQEVLSYVGVFTNITERVLANRQIRETAERLTNIMESISEGMMLVRSNWVVEYMNPAAEAITGTQEQQAIGKKLLEAFPRLKRTAIMRRLRQALRNNEQLHFEEYFAPLEMWLDISCYCLGDGLTIYFRNVTDRKRAQMQLALEREAFASITAGNRNFTEIVTRVIKGIESIYPGSLCSLLMLRKDGQTVHHISAPSLPKAYWQAIDGAKIGPAAGSCGTAIYTGKMVITKDITTDPKWEHYSAFATQFGLKACWSHPLINSQGKAIGSFAIYYKQVREPAEAEMNLIQRVANFFTLIYENLQAEQSLHKSNERFELASRATDEAIWDWDVEQNTIQWSHAFYTLFGIAEHEKNDKLDLWESRLHPEDADRVLQSLRKALRNRKINHWSAEYRFRKKDGTYADVLDKGFMIRNKEHKVVRMVGAMQDISDRKRLHQQLLEQQINKQKQMAQVAVEAQEKERAEIGKELHDNVNQLLTTTKLYLELAKNNVEMREDLIQRSANNISEIIQEIRQLSRSLVPYSITDLGMVAAVNDLIETLQLVNVINIRFEHSGDLEKALSPSLKVTLFRIIQEQLNNIIKHAYANGVLIQLQNRGSFIQLTVKDDGIGFDMKTVKRGIGISNIMSRANMFDGKAAIISKPGKGCKLSVQIPLQ